MKEDNNDEISKRSFAITQEILEKYATNDPKALYCASGAIMLALALSNDMMPSKFKVINEKLMRSYEEMFMTKVTG